MKPVIEIKNGQVFDRLTVLYETDRIIRSNGGTLRAFLCRCECGNVKAIRLCNLRRKDVRGCGCLKPPPREKKDKRLYSMYFSMKRRCKGNQSGDRHDKYYSEKGIKICDEWVNDVRSFIKFAWDNGYDDSLSIDRIDGNKGYYPDNCRFVDFVTQSNNLSNNIIVTYNDITDTICNTLRRINREKDYITITCRMLRGISFIDAVNNPIKYKFSRRIAKYDLNMNFIEEANSMSIFAKQLGIKSTTSIRACITGKQQTAYGFIFKDITDES